MIFSSYLLLLALTLAHPVEAFLPQLAPYRPVLVLSLLVFALAVVDAMRNGEIGVRPRHLLLLGAFMGAIALSLMMAGWAGGALNAIVEFSAPALLFLTTALVVTTTQRLRQTCGVIVLVMVCLSVASICAYHYGFMVEQLVVRETAGAEDHLSSSVEFPIPAEDTSGTSLWRVHSWGFLSDPNDFSQAIVMCLPMLFGAWQRHRLLRNLVRVGIPAAVLVYATYLSHSRGAVLGLGALLLFGMMRKVGRAKAAVMVGMFAMAAIMVGFTGGRDYSSGEESAGGRIDAWSAGLQMLLSNPLSGVGYGTFTDHHYYTAHNSFVLCFAELGLLGYFIWVGLLVLAFKETSAAAALTPPDSEEHRWAMLLRLSLIGFMTCALFLSRTYQPTLYVLLALCYASWHCARTLVPEPPGVAVPEPSWVGATVSVMLVAIGIIYLVVRFQHAFVT